MQPQLNQIGSFEQLFQLYKVTRQPDIQRQSTAIKNVHNQLTDLIKGILSSAATAAQKERTLQGLIKANIKILKDNGAFAENTNPTFDLKALKDSLVSTYNDLEGSDNPSGAEFIKFLDDQCAGTERTRKQPTLGEARHNNTLNFLNNYVQGINSFNTVGYAYNKGQMGMSSTFMASVLRGEFTRYDDDTKYAFPHDSDDLSRCIFFLEDVYLKEKNRQDLTPGEKRILSVSGNWYGIVHHLDELRAAVRNNMPMDQLTQRLQVCMNWGKEHFREKPLDETEQKEIDSLVKELKVFDTKEGTVPLKGRSIQFANACIKALHANDYYIHYGYENLGGSRGTRRLTRGAEISLLEQNEFDYSDKGLSFRKRTAADDADTGILGMQTA